MLSHILSPYKNREPLSHIYVHKPNLRTYRLFSTRVRTSSLQKKKKKGRGNALQLRTHILSLYRSLYTFYHRINLTYLSLTIYQVQPASSTRCKTRPEEASSSPLHKTKKNQMKSLCEEIVQKRSQISTFFFGRSISHFFANSPD